MSDTELDEIRVCNSPVARPGGHNFPLSPAHSGPHCAAGFGVFFSSALSLFLPGVLAGSFGLLVLIKCMMGKVRFEQVGASSETFGFLQTQLLSKNEIPKKYVLVFPVTLRLCCTPRTDR